MGYVIKEYFADYYLHRSDITFDFSDGGSMKVHSNVAETWRVTIVNTGLNTQTGGRFSVLDINERDRTIIGFQEKAKEDGGWINAGFMVMGPDVFKYIDGDDTVFERKTLEALSTDSRLGVYKHHCFWQCMDTALDKGLLEKSWNNGDAPWKEWEGWK
jgi:glucose-1-phosphate cytidylyltransferase